MMEVDDEWRVILSFILIIFSIIFIMLCLYWMFVGICNFIIDCELIYNKVGEVIK